MELLKPSSQKVQAALAAQGVPCIVKEFPASTRTSAEAAAAIGCDVAQIAKSLVFRCRESDRPLLVIASGSNRVNETTISQIIGEPIGKASADFVREKTGFAIGGIPPVAHAEPIQTLIDEDLLHHNQLWAAAGTPHSVFQLTPDTLMQITQGQVVSVK